MTNDKILQDIDLLSVDQMATALAWLSGYAEDATRQAIEFARRYPGCSDELAIQIRARRRQEVTP